MKKRRDDLGKARHGYRLFNESLYSKFVTCRERVGMGAGCHDDHWKILPARRGTKLPQQINSGHVR